MSDVEKICWVNAARRKWTEDAIAADRAMRKAEVERTERERIAVRRGRMMWLLQRGVWALLGVAAAMIGVFSALEEVSHALFWVSVLFGAGVLSLLMEGEPE